LRELLASAELVDGARTWSGTATDLLALLSERISDETRRRKDWPKSARGLSGALRRIAPNLRAVGVEVDLDRRAGHEWKRTICISLVRESQSRCNQPSAPSASAGNPYGSRVSLPTVEPKPTVGNRRQPSASSANGRSVPTVPTVPTQTKKPTVGTKTPVAQGFAPNADGADGRVHNSQESLDPGDVDDDEIDGILAEYRRAR